MGKQHNLTKRKFGKLTAIQPQDKSKDRQIRWLCRCDCGQETIVRSSSLRSGHTKSCGCLQKEISIQYNTRHGHTKRGKQSKSYKAWYHIIQRCTNPNDNNYNNYGDRGIKVYKKWLKFENFLEDMGEAPKGLQIDRINNNKGYYKENCRWATPKQNSRNKRDNRLILYGGKIQCISAWAEELNISSGTLSSRLNRGWSVRRAFITPIKRKNYNGYSL